MPLTRCKTALLGLIAIGVITVPAHADGPAWTYVEAGYTDINVDDLHDDGNGWFGGASIGILNHFHVFGRITHASLDKTNFDYGRRFVGGGWHGLLGEKADLVGEIAWINSDYDFESDNGYFLRAGVRWVPVSLFEAGGWARYEDRGDLGDGIQWQANALIHVWRIGIGVEAELGDVDKYNGFVRFTFGGD